MNHICVPTVSYELATEVVATALQLAAEKGVHGVVSVVDPAMQLVAFGRADHATPHSAETSRRKADTAASTRKPTTAMRVDLAVALEHGTGGRLTSIAGGVPLTLDGLHLGGLGVAGGAPEDDAAIAEATVAAIAASAEARA